MREIALDTETTGLDVNNGHKIIEIGCIEMENLVPTGKFFHVFINPERPIDVAATAVHGLNLNFLKDKPVFAQIYQQFLDFISDSQLVIHNARFDVAFINHELSLISKNLQIKNSVIDTLKIAREKFPGSPANLNALCKRFNIDLSSRDSGHGALIDAQLLAKVYFELCDGGQLFFGTKANSTHSKTEGIKKMSRPYRKCEISEIELDAHKKILTKIKNPLWLEMVK